MNIEAAIFRIVQYSRWDQEPERNGHNQVDIRIGGIAIFRRTPAGESVNLVDGETEFVGAGLDGRRPGDLQTSAGFFVLFGNHIDGKDVAVESFGFFMQSLEGSYAEFIRAAEKDSEGFPLFAVVR